MNTATIDLKYYHKLLGYEEQVRDHFRNADKELEKEKEQILERYKKQLEDDNINYAEKLQEMKELRLGVFQDIQKEIAETLSTFENKPNELKGIFKAKQLRVSYENLLLTLEGMKHRYSNKEMTHRRIYGW